MLLSAAEASQEAVTVELKEARGTDRVAVLRSRTSVPTSSNKTHFLVPFWQVHFTNDSAEAIMAMSSVKVTTTCSDGRREHVHECRIPIMTKSCQIAAGRHLLYFKKRTEAAKSAAAQYYAKLPAVKKGKASRT